MQRGNYINLVAFWMAARSQRAMKSVKHRKLSCYCPENESSTSSEEHCANLPELTHEGPAGARTHSSLMTDSVISVISSCIFQLSMNWSADHQPCCFLFLFAVCFAVLGWWDANLAGDLRLAFCFWWFVFWLWWFASLHATTCVEKRTPPTDRRQKHNRGDGGRDKPFNT